MAISNKARDLKKEGKPVIGFGAGEPDFASPDYVINEVKIAAEDPKNHKYSPVAGLESLREEISRTTLKYLGFIHLGIVKKSIFDFLKVQLRLKTNNLLQIFSFFKLSSGNELMSSFLEDSLKKLKI